MVKSNEKKVAALSLDYESDYATDLFDCLKSTPRLANYCRSQNIPLTVFVEGRVLRHESRHLSAFAPGTEFGLHCNDHRQIPDTAQALRLGLESYANHFGVRPRSYRAGNYLMTPELLASLSAEHFDYDASFLPGLTRLDRQYEVKSGSPFVLDSGLWEIPVSVIPGTRIKLSMSQISLIGLTSTKLMAKLKGLPEPLVFVLHMHDLFPSSALKRASIKRQIGHRWNYRLGLVDPFLRFEKFVAWLKAEGYVFRRLSELLPRVP